jgi:hypothetical protein
MRRRVPVVCAILSVLLCGAGAPPFSIGASTGPEASARVDATVTRVVGGVRTTLPGAEVPALAPGDEVRVSFPDYTRPVARANYHVNVAFLTEAAPQRWLYERSGPYDQLFSNRRRGSGPALHPDIDFVYGSGDHRGIPIFFIVPEDAKTRGMDGVRDYVDAHPTDFKNMSESANQAVDRYSWLQDFLTSLSQGAIDPYSSQQRIADIATSLGAPSASIQACYTDGGTQGDVENCIANTVQSLELQTNIEAPTEAQFLGGLAGAAAPTVIAPYLESLLTIWAIFVHDGHQEYEYLPTTLQLATPKTPGAKTTQLLMGLKVPTLRPPAATSSALFFTIGDPQSADAPPVVVNDAAHAGMCARDTRLRVPLHLDRTSKYVNATQLLVTPDGGATRAIPLDPRSLDAPLVARTELGNSSDGGYDVRLAGRFGFDPIVEPDVRFARVVVPHTATWTVAELPHRTIVTGGSLDVVATSAAAPCLSSAELQIGDAAPVPLAVKAVDATHVALHASLANTPPGEAQIRFYQADDAHATTIESTTAVAIAPAPPHVAGAAVADLGDSAFALTGTGFDSVTGVRLNGATYAVVPGSSATSACVTGPPLRGAKLVAGSVLSGQLLGPNGSPGDVFVVHVGPARPAIGAPSIDTASGVHVATYPLTVSVDAPNGVPADYALRLRHAVVTASPCEALAADDTAATVAAGDVHQRTAQTLDAVVNPEDLLHDRAFGTLQIQLVDLQSKAASDWEDLPGTFARAPVVAAIECPADPATPCTLLGTELASIARVTDAAGHVFAPSHACSSDRKGMDCLALPHLKQYDVILEDAPIVLSVPESAVVPAGVAKKK